MSSEGPRGRGGGRPALLVDDDAGMRDLLEDRLTSLGTVAASVAHEINNPLAYVIANLELVSQALADDPEPPAPGSRRAQMAAALGEARAGLHRIRTIVRDLRTFSQPSDESRTPVDVERVLDSAANIVSSEIHHRARLIKDYDRVPPVLASEARLGQVFLNLIVNAAQAIPEGGGGDHEIRLVTRRGPTGRITIEVRDTGSGIPEEARAHIFEPFFTTKPAGVGTGLGLSICRNLVSKLGGTIAVESAPGRGSVFRVELPEEGLGAPAPSAKAVSVLPPAPLTRARILVVDDEERLCLILGQLLGEEHDVTTLTSAREAAARIHAGERFDVIFSDLVMPGMSGMDLHAEVTRISADQARRMVFLTGGAFTPQMAAFIAEVPNRFLDKPFDYRALAAVAREVAWS